MPKTPSNLPPKWLTAELRLASSLFSERVCFIQIPVSQKLMTFPSSHSFYIISSMQMFVFQTPKKKKKDKIVFSFLKGKTTILNSQLFYFQTAWLWLCFNNFFHFFNFLYGYHHFNTCRKFIFLHAHFRVHFMGCFGAFGGREGRRWFFFHHAVMAWV